MPYDVSSSESQLLFMLFNTIIECFHLEEKHQQYDVITALSTQHFLLFSIKCKQYNQI